MIPTAERPSAQASAPAAIAGRPCVLVVDDSPTYLAFVKAALEALGCEVATSTDIWIAPVISKMRPRLVLLDVQIGALVSGLSAVKAIRNSKNASGTVIVLLSSLPPDELARLAAECGANGYIHKDGSAGSLISAVRPYLEMERN